MLCSRQDQKLLLCLHSCFLKSLQTHHLPTMTMPSALLCHGAPFPSRPKGKQLNWSTDWAHSRFPLIYSCVLLFINTSLLRENKNQGEGSAGKSNRCTDIRTKSSNHYHPHKNTTRDYDSELGTRQRVFQKLTSGPSRASASESVPPSWGNEAVQEEGTFSSGLHESHRYPYTYTHTHTSVHYFLSYINLCCKKSWTLCWLILCQYGSPFNGSLDRCMIAYEFILPHSL